jgi:hypothetical protein
MIAEVVVEPLDFTAASVGGPIAKCVGLRQFRSGMHRTFTE